MEALGGRLAQIQSSLGEVQHFQLRTVQHGEFLGEKQLLPVNRHLDSRQVERGQSLAGDLVIVNVLPETAGSLLGLLLEVEAELPGVAGELQPAVGQVELGDPAGPEELGQTPHHVGLLCDLTAETPAGDIEFVETEGGVGGQSSQAQLDCLGVEAEGEAGEVKMAR